MSAVKNFGGGASVGFRISRASRVNEFDAVKSRILVAALIERFMADTKLDNIISKSICGLSRNIPQSADFNTLCHKEASFYNARGLWTVANVEILLCIHDSTEVR